MQTSECVLIDVLKAGFDFHKFSFHNHFTCSRRTPVCLSVPTPQTGNGHALPPGCFLPPMPAATSACGGYAPASSNHGTSASSKSSLLLQWRQHAAVLLGASRAGAPEAARCSQALSRLGEQLKRLPGQVGAGRIDLLSGHIDVLSLSAHSHGQSAANSVC